MIFGGQANNPYYFPALIDLSAPSLWVSAASICFNPLFWNTVAQNEYRNKTITKLLGNKPYWGCYLLGASIFFLGILRDHLYNQALASQPANPYLLHPAFRVGGALLFGAGQIFVISSMWALGFTGTYLGDYFGILMDSIVTGFPFNVISDPMYWGSSLCFVGVALWFGKPAGLALSVLVVIVYWIALQFEGPFTANIYAQAAKSKKSRKSTSKASSTSNAKSSKSKSTTKSKSATSETKTPARRNSTRSRKTSTSSSTPRSRKSTSKSKSG